MNYIELQTEFQTHSHVFQVAVHVCRGAFEAET